MLVVRCCSTVDQHINGVVHVACEQLVCVHPANAVPNHCKILLELGPNDAHTQACDTEWLQGRCILDLSRSDVRSHE